MLMSLILLFISLTHFIVVRSFSVRFQLWICLIVMDLVAFRSIFSSRHFFSFRKFTIFRRIWVLRVFQYILITIITIFLLSLSFVLFFFFKFVTNIV